MADIAVIFHWPPSEMAAMELEELERWHTRAIDRWNHIHQAQDT